jgi:nucleoside 2-deoxyribosyltransferase
MRIYLAGAIRNTDDATTWRRDAASQLPDWDVIDPTRLEQFIEDQHAEENARKIVRDDLRAVESSNVVLALVDMPSWGTAMEIFYASQLKIPVIGWNPGNNPVSPWLMVHCNIIIPDFWSVKKHLQTLLAKA